MTPSRFQNLQSRFTARISESRLLHGALAVMAPVCACCSDVIEPPLLGCVCQRCWHAVTPVLKRPSLGGWIDGIAAGGEYDGTLREIVHAFKYQQRRSLARPLADLMRRHGGEVLSEADMVVPVPLHWRRRYARGFNQARDLAGFLEKPVLDVLVRSRHTFSQVRLEASARASNVRGAFALRRPVLQQPITIGGRCIVVVDDVMTTGATIQECARVLKEAGAARVCALTAACVPDLTFSG